MAEFRVVDIETTGMVPPQAELIELGWQDVTDGRVAGRRGSVLFGSERPCPPEVLAVHHISDRERAGLPIYTTEAGLTLVGESGCVGVAHNAEYEQQFIAPLFDRWVCTYKAALRVWPEAPSHGNQALMYFLGIDCLMEERLRHPPHRALPDAYVTAHILVELLKRATLAELLQWSGEPRLLPTCPIGKFRGRKWPEVETGFLNWMLGVPDMEADLKWNARRELDRRRTAHLAGD